MGPRPKGVLVVKAREARERSRDPETAAFLLRLHRGGKWAYLWTPEGSRSAWYPVGTTLPTLGGDARDVLFGVHPSNQIPETNGRGDAAPAESVRARKAHISAVNCLFAEFDAHGPPAEKAVLLQRIERITPPPSVIVDSGGGYHCYWLLAQSFVIETERDREWIDRVQKGWVARVGGDDGAKDLARLLRLPGTRNFKYVPARKVWFVRYDLERTYPLSELVQKARPTMPRKRVAHSAVSAVEVEPSLGTVARAAWWLDRLAQWRCDEYEPWIEVGMSLRQLGDIGLLLWDLWSRRSDKYERGVCQGKWNTFMPGEGLTLRSLAYWAEQDNPTEAQPPPAIETGITHRPAVPVEMAGRH
jgi:hypothetical protein